MSLLLTFYGDDFTGSTDALEVLASAGIPTILYLTIPTDKQLSAAPDTQAIGIAGISRSQNPAWMEANLPAVFNRLKSLEAPVFHYKVCSTFDSTPAVGNIGRAAEIGRAIFGDRPVPVVVGAPALGRYVMFGNLFATAAGVTYRIDRHPVMSRHPTTPMDEADLRLHLARQSPLASALVDHAALNTLPLEELRHRVQGSEAGLVVLDTVDAATQKVVGRILWPEDSARAFFVIGSSGVEFSLVDRWRELGLAPASVEKRTPDPVDRIAVLSGSCSGINEIQIRRALENGFTGLPLDPQALIASEAAIEDASARAVDLLAKGASPLLYTALGPKDGVVAQSGADGIAFNTCLGERLGIVFRDILRRSGVRRAVVAGGDTSGHVTNQLGLYALSYRAALVRGCPLCLTHSERPEFDGRELALKGGQMGGESFFSQVRAGMP
jgi:uncharacterized protein YgbK (DUF1537 family)